MVILEVASSKTMTKIVCTIGPASQSQEMLKRLATAGMNVARLNLSHGNIAQHSARIQRVRAVAEKTKTPIGILADLPGPKIRVGRVYPEPAVLREGSQVTLTGRNAIGGSRLIPISNPSILRGLSTGDTVFLADGMIRLMVQHRAESDVTCRVIRGGRLYSGKGVNIPSNKLGLRALTNKDVALLWFALRNGADFIGLSFTTCAEDVRRAKRLVRRMGRWAWVIAKIEKRQAVEHFDEIVQEADGIMVARGDLGVEMDIEDVPVIQKQIIEKANAAGKPVITATQMLESMVNNPTPTRAEVTDIANAIIDGTDAVMLSEETAVGQYPVEAVSVMRRVAKATERNLPFNELLNAKRKLVQTIVQEAISFSACDVAQTLGASCIVAHTRTGMTAHRVSKYRSPVPIMALTYHPPVMNRLSLLWGVYPQRVGRLSTTAEIFRAAKNVARRSRTTHSGDRIVVVCGDPSTAGGTTDLLRVQTV